MSGVFVDTSAIMALLVPSDIAHDSAKKNFARLRDRRATLMTTSYVLVETYALLGRRFGIEAVARFRSEFAPLFRVFWVAENIHERGLDLVVKEGRRDLSLVDATSILVAMEAGADEVFAYDRHFMGRGPGVVG